MSKALRGELGGTNVDQTLVCPGHVRTNAAHAMREQRESQSRDDNADLDTLLDLIEAGVSDESAMDPGEVGTLVVQAVKANDFWLLPNGAAQLPLLKQDFDEIRISRSSLAL